MNWELILLLTGIMLFAYWLNYIMGSPLADKPEDVDIKAILFDIPNAMALKRLNDLDLLKARTKSLMNDLSVTSDPAVRVKTRNDHKLDDYIAGREFFTWERAFLCPICLHFWATIITAVILLVRDSYDARDDFFQGAFTYLVLHLIIRKIS